MPALGRRRACNDHNRSRAVLDRNPVKADAEDASYHLGQAIGFARAVYLLATEFPLTDSRDTAALAAISRALVDNLDAADRALSSALMPET